MNRSSIVFLSLFILVACLVLAGSTVKIGKAAPDREIPWWLGETRNKVYIDHTCKDGVVIWAGTQTDNEDLTVSISAELSDGSQLFNNLTRIMDQPGDGIVSHMGKWVLGWPEELVPGSRVRFRLDFNNSAEEYINATASVENCFVPSQPEPTNYNYEFYCDYSDQCEDWQFPIAQDSCEVVELEVSLGVVISDVDAELNLTSAPSAYTSVSMISPQGTRVDLLDGQSLSSNKTLPSFKLGDGWLGFRLDDDSTFYFADGTRPYTLTSFKPSPGSLSQFKGENSAGIWQLEVCNHSAPVSEQETIIRNGYFEQGNSSWNEYSSNDFALIYHESDSFITPHSGSWMAWLGGENDETSELSQSISLPNGFDAHQPSLHLWYQVKSDEQCGSQYDVAQILINGERKSNLDLCVNTETPGWQKWPESIDLDYTASEIMFRVTTDYSNLSSLFLDEVTIEYGQTGSLLDYWRLDIAEATTYTLSISTNGQGMVQQDPYQAAYESGDNVTLTAWPATGHRFTGWSGSLSGTQNPAQIVMNGDKSVTASFQPISTSSGIRLFLPVALRQP